MPAAAALTALLLLVGWFNRTDGAIAIAALKPVYSWADMKGDRTDVARWAKANTPEKSLWITPPEMENFRLIGERPIVVDYTSIPFGADAMREWRRRIEDLYGPVSGQGFDAWRSMDRNYRRISPEALKALGGRYGASHAVIYASTDWPEPVLYENARYKVVALSSAR